MRLSTHRGARSPRPASMTAAATCVAIIWLSTAAAANAAVVGHVGGERELAAGPVFAGLASVWLETDAAGSFYLRRSGQSSGPRLVDAPREDLAHEILDLAASSRVVAVVRKVTRPPPPPPPCDVACPASPLPPPRPISDEVWMGPPTGPLRRVVRRTASQQCGGALAPREVEVVEGTVFVAERHARDVICERRRRSRHGGRIVAIGPRHSSRVLVRLRSGKAPRHVSAAGRWIAWQSSDDLRGSVVVWDRRRSKLAYRVAARKFAAASFDLDGSGRIAMVGEEQNSHPCGPNEPRFVYRLAVASPLRPAPRRVVDLAANESVALTRGRLVWVGVDKRCLNPVGLIGRRIAGGFGPRRSFGLPCAWRFADVERPEFDGSRVVFATPAPSCPARQDPPRVIETASLR
jgi:hypothetical protein